MKWKKAKVYLRKETKILFLIGSESKRSGFSRNSSSILGFLSRDETAMLVYKTMAKCCSSFA